VTKCLKINQNKLHMQFSAVNADFSSSRVDPVNSRSLAYASVKRGTFLKSGYVTDIGVSSVKTVADRPRYAAYHENH